MRIKINGPRGWGCLSMFVLCASRGLQFVPGLAPPKLPGGLEFIVSSSPLSATAYACMWFVAAAFVGVAAFRPQQLLTDEEIRLGERKRAWRVLRGIRSHDRIPIGVVFSLSFLACLAYLASFGQSVIGHWQGSPDPVNRDWTTSLWYLATTGLVSAIFRMRNPVTRPIAVLLPED